MVFPMLKREAGGARTCAARLPIAAISLFLFGCAEEPAVLEPPPAPRPPEEVGPYSIGVTTISVESAGRTLPVEIWYPALASGVLEEYPLKAGVLVLTTLATPMGARRDAPLDARGGPYPAIVFSHGNGGTRYQSVYLTEYLATHGFVVAAPDHVGNTFAEEVNTANAISRAEAAVVRPEDVSRSLDALLAASQSDGGLLAGAVDATRVGVAGHSFGGFKALRIAGATIDNAAVLADCLAVGGLICDGWDKIEMPVSAHDDRFKAALSQSPGGAPAMFAGSRNGFADVAMPILVQGGTLDEITPFASEQQAPYDALPAPAMLLAIDKAGHFTFSDMCLLVEKLGLMSDQFQDGCGSDNVPWSDAHPIIQRYSTAFFQSTLAGLPSAPLLHAQTPLAAGVSAFTTK